MTNSLALLSDAGHMLSDIAALSLSLFAFQISRRPATPQKTFGYHRLEIVAALVNGLVLWLIVGVIFHELEQTRSMQPILFLPDVYLGYYAARLLEQQGSSLDRLWLMMGACHVHDRIRPYHVEKQRRRYPDAATVIHPECGCTSACMRQMSQGAVPEGFMEFRSTQCILLHERTDGFGVCRN